MFPPDQGQHARLLLLLKKLKSSSAKLTSQACSGCLDKARHSPGSHMHMHFMAVNCSAAVLAGRALSRDNHLRVSNQPLQKPCLRNAAMLLDYCWEKSASVDWTSCQHNSAHPPTCHLDRPNTSLILLIGRLSPIARTLSVILSCTALG